MQHEGRDAGRRSNCSDNVDPLEINACLKSFSHAAILICPYLSSQGTREKVRHVIGRRPKYPHKKREMVQTDTIIRHTVVSGLHCMIWREWDPDAPGDPSLAIAYLEDHSTNGTFVNGEKIKNQKIAIGDGDDISLGQIVTGRELASEFRGSNSIPFAFVMSVRIDLTF